MVRCRVSSKTMRSLPSGSVATLRTCAPPKPPSPMDEIPPGKFRPGVTFAAKKPTASSAMAPTGRRNCIQFLRPVGAMALLAVGFFAAKVTPGLNLPGGISSMGLGGFGGAQVRNVATEPDGRLRIVFDETRQRTISGSKEDQQI